MCLSACLLINNPCVTVNLKVIRIYGIIIVIFFFLSGYGLTETSPILTIGQRDSYDPATAGVLICNTEAKVYTLRFLTPAT